MKKTNPTNKTKGLFGIFATLALALGLSVSIAPRKVVKTEAATTESFTISSAAMGSNSNLGNGAYASGAERKATISTIEIGGKAITATNKNTPNTGDAGRFIQTQKSNGVIYNIDALPGRLISVELNQYSAISHTLYGGSESRLVNSTSGNYTVTGGTSVGTLSAVSSTLTVDSANNYTFFAIKTGTSAGSYISSIVITYAVTPAIPVESVTVSPKADTILIGETTQLNATVLPSDAPEDVEWSSNAEGVATVNQSGLVTAVGVGTAIITAKSTVNNEKTDYATITVSPVSVASVSLNKTNVEVYEGKTEQLTETVLPTNATDKSVTWSSQNNNVVTVNNGLLTAVGAGSTTVTVKTVDGNKEAVANVTVLANPVEEFIVNHNNVKKVYSLGEEFTGFDGLVVKEKRADGEETVVSDYSISAINTMELGKQIVRIQKGSFSEEFVVFVKNEGASVGLSGEGTPERSFTETFDDLDYTGSSAVSGSFVGVENQLWTYENVRGDQELNGRDIAFGKNDGYLSTILENGLESLSLYYVKHFSTDADFEIYANGVKLGSTIDVLDGQDEPELLVLSNINLVGRVELEIVTYNRLGIDDITITIPGTSVSFDITPTEQALAFARFVGRAKPSVEGKGILKSLLGPATIEAPTWEEVEEEKGAMDPESLEVFENSDDPDIVAGREVYQELLEENDDAYGDAAEFHAYIMGLTSEGDTTTANCLTNFNSAKEEWNKLSEAAREAFLLNSNSAFNEGRSRLLHWTFVNGWELNGVNLQEQPLGGRTNLDKDSVSHSITATVIIGVIGLTTIAGFNFLRKKKQA